MPLMHSRYWIVYMKQIKDYYSSEPLSVPKLFKAAIRLFGSTWMRSVVAL